jgi:CheY-like chemotaxis protein
MTTRIMVVDDEPAIGRLLTYQLTACGYHVSYIQDGLLALHKIFSDRPDLVLLDVMMPLISGWEICRQIRACSTIPVIMLTGKSADPDIVAGLHAGADDYVTKPCSLVQLQARIEAVLRRASPAQFKAGAYRSAPPSDAHLAVLDSNISPETPALPDSLHHLAPPPPPQVPMPHLGVYVRQLRQSRGVSLLQAERACSVRWEFLQAIEQENWSYVPHHELRRAIRSYGEFLGVNLFELAGRQKTQLPSGGFHPLQFMAVLSLLVGLLIISYYLL